MGAYPPSRCGISDLYYVMQHYKGTLPTEINNLTPRC